MALNLFERNGLIKSHRGVITIVDRKGVRRVSNGAYGVPEVEFNRLFANRKEIDDQSTYLRMSVTAPLQSRGVSCMSENTTKRMEVCY